MRYLSVCSGIEAATCAWHHMGWEPVAFSEIEAFPSAVLAHHYPNVPNWGDMTKFQEWPDANVDVLVGGTPCQSFSVAGLRKGLDDPRGNLMLTYLAIAQRYRPKWLVWENVPGVLSSAGGRDFAALLRGLDELGYGWAYRVLDAQYFGVAQRRRRVFVVGHLGNWQRAAAVLFERHSLSGHPAPSRKARKGVAGGVAPSVAGSLDTECGGSRLNHQSIASGHIFAVDAFNQADTGDLSKTVAARNDQDTASLVTGCWWDGGDVAATITTKSDDQRMPDKANAQLVVQPIPYDLYQITAPVNRQNRKPGDPCHTLARDNAAHAAVAIQGTLIGRSENAGPQGSGADVSGAMFTLTKTDVHAVAIQDIRAVEKAQNGRGWNDDGSAYTVDTHATQGVAVAQPLSFPWQMGGTIQMPVDKDLSGSLIKNQTMAVAQPVAVAFGVNEQPDVGHCLRSGASKADKHESTTYVAQPVAWDEELNARTNLAGAMLRGGDGGRHDGVMTTAMQVRRLTPTECERLQGFPDGYTDIPWRGKPESPDGPRYKALGNSMAVPVMRWIGERINEVSKL